VLKKWRSKLAALALAVIVAVAAGCQAVGGLDLNQVLKNTLKVESMEGNQTISFELLVDEEMLNDEEMAGFLDEEEKALFELLRKIQVELTDIKQQDREHVSMNGKLLLGGESKLAFSMKLSPAALVLELEGAKQPFVLDMTGETWLGMNGMDVAAGAAGLGDDEALTAMGLDIADKVADYAITHMPNPDKLKVKPASAAINGEQVSLMHVQAEMNGADMAAWLIKFADALLADKDGMNAMVKGIMDVLASNPDIWESIGEANPFETDQLDAPTPDEMAKEAVDALETMLLDLKEGIEYLQQDEMFADLLGEALTAKVDLYVDGKLDIRKQSFELTYKMAEASAVQESEDGVEEEYAAVSLFPWLKGFTFRTDSDIWNVNGEVKAEPATAPADAVAVEELMLLEGYEALDYFEEDSFLYDLLRNKLQITKQTYTVYNQYSGNPAIVLPNGLTIVAVRDVADALGAEIVYDKPTKTVTLYDKATDTTIEFRLGSDKFVVNGAEQQWPATVSVIDGSAYVPARMLAEALGASIEWETIYEGWRMLRIERVL